MATGHALGDTGLFSNADVLCIPGAKRGAECRVHSRRTDITLRGMDEHFGGDQLERSDVPPGSPQPAGYRRRPRSELRSRSCSRDHSAEPASGRSSTRRRDRHSCRRMPLSAAAKDLLTAVELPLATPTAGGRWRQRYFGRPRRYTVTDVSSRTTWSTSSRRRCCRHAKKARRTLRARLLVASAECRWHAAFSWVKPDQLTAGLDGPQPRWPSVRVADERPRARRGCCRDVAFDDDGPHQSPYRPWLLDDFEGKPHESSRQSVVCQLPGGASPQASWADRSLAAH